MTIDFGSILMLTLMLSPIVGWGMFALTIYLEGKAKNNSIDTDINTTAKQKD